MKVICTEEAAFYELLDNMVARVKELVQPQEEWLDTNGAMAYLKISSKTTLQKIREENSDVIRFVRLSSKLLLYFKPSLDAYLQQNLNA